MDDTPDIDDEIDAADKIINSGKKAASRVANTGKKVASKAARKTAAKAGEMAKSGAKTMFNFTGIPQLGKAVGMGVLNLPRYAASIFEVGGKGTQGIAIMSLIGVGIAAAGVPLGLAGLAGSITSGLGTIGLSSFAATTASSLITATGIGAAAVVLGKGVSSGASVVDEWTSSKITGWAK